MPVDISNPRALYDAIEDALGAEGGSLRERLLRHNAGALAKLNERTIRKIVKSEEISARNAQTRRFLAEFLEMATPDLAAAKKPAAAAILDALRRHRAAAPASAPEEQTGASAAAAFVAFLSDKYRQNNTLAEQNFEVKGYYWLTSKNSHEGLDDFHDEPIFVGDAAEPSWLLSRRHGIHRGFTFVSAGIATVFLAYKHNVRQVGFRVIMIHFNEDAAGDAFPGLMTRFSDYQWRPEAAHVVLRRADDDALLERWSAIVAADAAPSEVARRVAIVGAADDAYPLYETLIDDTPFKSRNFDEWRALLRDQPALRAFLGVDEAD